MKRIEYTKFGGPEVLKVVDFDINNPKSNEVQIKTHFAGVNFAEIMTRMGLYPGAPKPPSSIGGEASGIVHGRKGRSRSKTIKWRNLSWKQ